MLNANTYTQTQGTLGLTSNNGNYALSFANPTPNNYQIKAASLTVTPNAVATSYNGVALKQHDLFRHIGELQFWARCRMARPWPRRGIGLTGSLAFNGSTATSVLKRQHLHPDPGHIGADQQ